MSNKFELSRASAEWIGLEHDENWRRLYAGQVEGTYMVKLSKRFVNKWDPVESILKNIELSGAMVSRKVEQLYLLIKNYRNIFLKFGK